MNVAPARMEQVRMTEDGDWAVIGKDSSSVAADLHAIDPGLKVRFSKTQHFFVIYHERRNPDGSVTHDWISTIQAHQNASGVWEGLDNRAVEHVRRIDPQGRGNYDYAREVERRNQQARQDAKRTFHEKTGPYGERAAWAVRKDLGVKNRAFINRKEQP